MTMKKISETAQKARDLYKSHLWQGRLILAAVIMVLVMVVIRVSLPYTIVYSSIYWLGTQGIEATIDDIVINVTRGTFSVINASGTKDGDRIFNIGKASIDWEWRPLTGKTIHIKGVELDGFSLAAEQHKDALVIGGVVIRSDGSVEAPPAEAKDAVAWGASLDRIDFKDMGFCFKQFETAFDERSEENSVVDYCGDVGLAAWQGDFNLVNDDTAGNVPRQKLLANGSLNIEKLKLFILGNENDIYRVKGYVQTLEGPTYFDYSKAGFSVAPAAPQEKYGLVWIVRGGSDLHPKIQ